MKNSEKAGSYKIVILTTLSDFWMQMVIQVINEIYNSGEILEDLSNLIFVELPKKPGELIINLMSHRNELIIRMLINSWIIPEIWQEQCSFVQDTEVSYLIFIKYYQTEIYKCRTIST